MKTERERIAKKQMGQRIRAVMKQREVTQLMASKQFGVSQAAVYGWLKTGSIDKERLLALCNYLNINVEWVVTGKGESEKHNNPPVKFDSKQQVLIHKPHDKLYSTNIEQEIKQLNQTDSVAADSRQVPHLSWRQAGMLQAGEVFKGKPEFGTVTVSEDIASSAFAVTQRGDSMTATGEPRSIGDGQVVILDPTKVTRERELMHRRIVLAKRAEDEHAMLRMLWFDGTHFFLRAFNPAHAPLACMENTQIMGVAVKLQTDL